MSKKRDAYTKYSDKQKSSREDVLPYSPRGAHAA